jgi:hypothetical protein
MGKKFINKDGNFKVLFHEAYNNHKIWNLLGGNPQNIIITGSLYKDEKDKNNKSLKAFIDELEKDPSKIAASVEKTGNSASSIV